MGVRETAGRMLGWLGRMTTGASGASSGGSSTRAERLSDLVELFEGEQYEDKGLSAPWTKQRPGGPKVPVRFQRPAVQYDLPKLIVERPTALLFGDGRFPHIAFENKPGESDKAVDAWLAAIVEEGHLDAEALLWARLGSVRGSSVLTWYVVDNGDGEGEFCFEAHKSEYCTPTFHARARKRLVALEKRYKFKKEVRKLVEGRLVTSLEDYWHREEWTEQAHIVYVEVPVGDGKEPAWTVEDQVDHNLGCPAVWVKDRDDGEPGNCDGISALDGLYDAVEDIDRTISHSGRALHYNLEPDKVYSGLPMDEKTKKPIVVGGGGSTSLPVGATAELLEMKGTAIERAEERVDAQRARALETARVVVPDTDTIARASTSGAAIRLLLAPMLELVAERRHTYGAGLTDILNQILAAARNGKLAQLGTLKTPPPDAIPKGRIKITWGQFVDPTPQDLELIARAAASLKAGGVLDHETLLRWLAPYVGLRDIQQVLANIEKEEAEDYADEEGGGAAPGAPRGNRDVKPGNRKPTGGADSGGGAET